MIFIINKNIKRKPMEKLKYVCNILPMSKLLGGYREIYQIKYSTNFIKNVSILQVIW
jgi:hypothetical protein